MCKKPSWALAVGTVICVGTLWLAHAGSLEPGASPEGVDDDLRRAPGVHAATAVDFGPRGQSRGVGKRGVVEPVDRRTGPDRRCDNTGGGDQGDGYGQSNGSS